MSTRAWLDLAEPPPSAEVLAETTLRAALWPRLLAATWALLDRAPDGHVADADRARWLAVCAAIDRDEAEAAMEGLAALEREAGVSTP